MNQISLIHLNSVDSTSNYAKSNISNLTIPALIIADEQTQGRGRRGNSFFSPKNTGLYMTFVTELPEKTNLITPAAAVAVCIELEKLGLSPKIKWVNDIFIENKKVCGILTELISKDNNNFISVGIGINLTTTDFPDNIPIAGSLNSDCNKSELAENISKTFSEIINSDTIKEEYLKRLFIIGKTVFYSKNNQSYSAVATDINDNCNLIVLLPDGTTDILSSGEISIKF